MDCIECNKQLTNKWSKKFCCHSCAAKFNNRNSSRRKIVTCCECKSDFRIANWVQRVKFLCFQCIGNKTKLVKEPTQIKQNNKLCKTCSQEFISHHNRSFCSKHCKSQQSKKYTRLCKHCNVEYKSEKPDSKFCSRSCRSKALKLHTFAHTRSGLSRSKIEEYIETQLLKDFPNIEFIFNDKNTIGSELDIFIPRLKMAFELNGIFHYLPIYGENTLIKTQNRDKQKAIVCYERGIELVTINLGTGGFTKKLATTVYNQIFDIIERNKNRVNC